jgi:hypothetical protein
MKYKSKVEPGWKFIGWLKIKWILKLLILSKFTWDTLKLAHHDNSVAWIYLVLSKVSCRGNWWGNYLSRILDELGNFQRNNIVLICFWGIQLNLKPFSKSLPILFLDLTEKKSGSTKKKFSKFCSFYPQRKPFPANLCLIQLQVELV